MDGKNITIERRYAEGSLNRASAMVMSLIEQKVNVIVVSPFTVIQTAKKTTKTIPIVMVTGSDPVATGLVDSLAHPGGNITGVTRLTRELSPKRLELLKEIIPKMSHAGVLWDAAASGSAIGFREYESAAPAFKLQLQSLEVRGLEPDLEAAFQAAEKAHVDALITGNNLMTLQHMNRIIELAAKYRLPTMYEESQWVEGGGFSYYGADLVALYRRAAFYVDKILKGTKPADLPVEQPTKFELVINLKTAKQIGLRIPPSVLFRADKVIK
jgi:putative ABC transport system substrate-binding protein